MSDQWTKVDVTAIDFPDECSSCGAPTERWEEITGGRGIWMQILERILGLGTYLTVPVPFCDDCAKRRRGRRIRGLVFGALGGLLAAIVAAVVLVGSFPVGHTVTYVVPGLIIVAGPVLGFLVGRTPPSVRFRNYSERNGSVEIAFANEDFQRASLELMQ